MGLEKKWYVVYSKPRWEKKVSALLSEKGITVYCPINRLKKRWSDRVKKVEQPLFTSYVFVQIHENEKSKVRETPGVINYVYFNGKPAIVKNAEIERIKKFLSENENVSVEPAEFKKNQRVIIEEGLFIEQEGTVVDLQNNKVLVEIESLGYTLVAVFDPSKLAKATE